MHLIIVPWGARAQVVPRAVCPILYTFTNNLLRKIMEIIKAWNRRDTLANLLEVQNIYTASWKHLKWTNATSLLDQYQLNKFKYGANNIDFKE
ncbi:hypothetical protein ACJX0J_012568, partial [Zea mays]